MVTNKEIIKEWQDKGQILYEECEAEGNNLTEEDEQEQEYCGDEHFCTKHQNEVYENMLDMAREDESSRLIKDHIKEAIIEGQKNGVKAGEETLIRINEREKCISAIEKLRIEGADAILKGKSNTLVNTWLLKAIKELRMDLDGR